MKIAITYHLPDGTDLYPTAGTDGLLSQCRADVSLEGIQVECMRRVLAELSEITARDFARLATLSCFKSNDASFDKPIESSLLDFCSIGSACDGAVLSCKVHPFSNQPK